MEEKDCSEIINIIAGHRLSMILFSCLKLEIFEVLHEKEYQTAEEIAEKLGTHKEATERILNAAAMLHLLNKEKDSKQDDIYQNSHMTTKYLLTSSYPSFRNYALLNYYFGYKLFHKLPEAIKTGCRQVAQTHNIKADLLFHIKEGIYSDDSLQNQFISGMDDHAAIIAPGIVKAFDLSQFSTICDLGGASGALGYELIRTYPQMKVIVTDLPNVIEMYSNFKPKDGGSYDNISFKAVDFFADELPEADLYTMTWILHDWDDIKIKELLSRIYSSLKTGGGLLIGEKMLSEDKVGPSHTLTVDLAMLLATLGKERTFSEYKHLLKQQGFQDIQLKVTNSFSDAILCFKR